MSYTPVVPGLWSALETVVVSNQATVDMDLTGTYDEYVLHIQDLVPITDGTELWMRFSVDGGSSFLAGASDYSWDMDGAGLGTNTDGDPNVSEINLTKDFGALLGTGTIESFNGWVRIHNPKQSTKAICVTCDQAQIPASGTLDGQRTGGTLFANIDEVDSIRLLTNSGNLDTGTITLYGVSQ